MCARICWTADKVEGLRKRRRHDSETVMCARIWWVANTEAKPAFEDSMVNCVFKPLLPLPPMILPLAVSSIESCMHYPPKSAGQKWGQTFKININQHHRTKRGQPHRELGGRAELHDAENNHSVILVINKSQESRYGHQSKYC
jgi:hypothetical protein